MHHYIYCLQGRQKIFKAQGQNCNMRPPALEVSKKAEKSEGTESGDMFRAFNAACVGMFL